MPSFRCNDISAKLILSHHNRVILMMSNQLIFSTLVAYTLTATWIICSRQAGRQEIHVMTHPSYTQVTKRRIRIQLIDILFI